MGPLEYESLASLSGRGFRFSMDHVTDLRMEPRELSERGFRYLKVPGAMLLKGATLSSGDIHPADLSDLLARYHIDLIAERIESESAWSTCSTSTCASARASCSRSRVRCAPKRCRGRGMAATATACEAKPVGNEPPPRMPGINDPGAPRLAPALGVVA